MITNYILEQLNVNYVNVVFIKTAIIDNKTYEIERSRTCYGNSLMGRQRVIEQLPELYTNAIFDIWGEEPTLIDPEPPEID